MRLRPANPTAYAQKVADRFATMTLPYQIGSNAAFDYVGINGRWLSDDVMDVMLSVMTNSALGDGGPESGPYPRRLSVLRDQQSA